MMSASDWERAAAWHVPACCSKGPARSDTRRGPTAATGTTRRPLRHLASDMGAQSRPAAGAPAAPAAAAEEDFPRGGGGALSALERKRLRAEAEEDAARDFFSPQHDAAGAPRKRRRKAEAVRCRVGCTNCYQAV